MAPAFPRHYIKVAAPSMHAGIGEALRFAYSVEKDGRMPRMFEDLLAKLR